MHTPSSYSHSHQIHPHSRVLWGIKNRISELLESEAYQHQSQKLERLFTQLNDELDAKVNKAWYDYKDYKQRLFRWEEELEAIVQQDQDLRVHYENILRAIKFAPYLKQALWDKLLFDRLLELWPSAQEFLEPVTFSFAELKTNPEIPSSLKIKNLPSEASVQELEEVFSKIENAPWVLSIDLTYNNLRTFRKDQLQAIFSHLWNVRSIDLSWNNLWKLDEPRLQSIFSHLRSVKNIDLSRNGLDMLDEPSLKAVFSHLWNVRSIDLRNNKLWILDLPRLQSIFSHLWNVKIIDLWNNDIWQLDEPRLHAIFLHLSWVRSIDLRRNDLWVLWEDQLQAIFSHLWNLRTIDLSTINLWQLDEPRLQAIFSHLIHIEEVILKSQEEASKLESLFPNLIGKFKIQ